VIFEVFCSRNGRANLKPTATALDGTNQLAIKMRQVGDVSAFGLADLNHMEYGMENAEYTNSNCSFGLPKICNLQLVVCDS
jgi:hypothetical protein